LQQNLQTSFTRPLQTKT